MSEAKDWGKPKPNPNAHWVKTRDLVGKHFQLVRVNKGNVDGRPCYIFECSDGALFSQGVSSTIGKQVERAGIPPAGTYTIDAPTTNSKGEPIKSPTGYALVLRGL